MKFSFNLLPKETFEKREIIRAKIDKTIIGSAFLPLLAVVIWIILFLFNYSIKLQIQNRNKIIEENNQLISAYDEIRRDRAFLVMKTRKLEEIIYKDVNPEVFFGLVRSTISSLDIDVSVLSFGRNQDGRFEVELEASSVEDLVLIANKFRHTNEITNFELNRFNFVLENNSKLKMTMIFGIKNIQE